MTYTCINIYGNLLSEEILQKLEQESQSLAGQKAGQFGFDAANLRSEIEYAWSKIRLDWDYFQSKALNDKDPYGTSITRRWCENMLAALGYTLAYQRSSLPGDNQQSYAISHVAPDIQNMPVLIAGFFDPQKEAEGKTYSTLDIRSSGGSSKRSPHATLQEYLNATEHIYGLVSNGYSLRLIRNSGRLVKLTYIDFDIKRMLEEDKYSEFVLLFRLMHASRFIAAEPEPCFMEQYFLLSIDSGNRIRNGLSAAVKKSIMLWAEGLVNHPDNHELRKALQDLHFSGDDLYKELLRLIYRLLFLMVTEERDLVYDNNTLDADGIRKKNIYFRYYSLQRLRKLSRNDALHEEKYTDLWQGLLNTFRLYETGGNGGELGIQALAGDLFSCNAISRISNCTISNKVLLECIRNLNEFRDEKGNTLPVNYGALDVEEFGSVYEGLLEYSLSLSPSLYGMYAVVFDTSRVRSTTGSHYTPEQLVEPLIKHSLSYLIDNCVKPFYQGKAEKAETIQKLLDLKVCDITCGSGHILLSGARRIALELARVETDEEQPNPKAFKIAMREVIKNCIYGVDYNPLAVELCKVALWLEAHIPGEALTFLDHHIRCGNSVLGLAFRDELKDGIANEAFNVYNHEDNDKKIAASYKKRNAAERKIHDHAVTQHTLNFEKPDTDHSLLEALEEYKVLLKMPEHTAEEVEKKQQYYEKYLHGKGFTFLSNMANLQLAQFFILKNEDNKKYLLTDAEYRDILSGRTGIHAQKTGMANAIAQEYKFFHWFLEFPEIFQRGGFDCILGNPPFLGRQKLSGTYGKDFLEYLKYYFAPIGCVDFVTYFFRRAYSVIRPGGFQSLIATNTIAQGAAREGGLDVICARKGIINHAVRSLRWPGIATVEVALVTIHKGKWEGAYQLDGKKVERITPYLDSSEMLGNPCPLKQNTGKSFIGSYVLGMGFVLESEEAQALIAKDPHNKDVLFPYLNGEDLNNDVAQKPSRWVINFFDWEEDDARNYPDCFDIIEEKVKPEREKLDEKKNSTNKNRKEYWWRYAADAKSLYYTISDLKQIVIINRYTKHFTPAFSKNGITFSDSIVTFALEGFYYFSILSSILHDIWAWKNSSTMGTSTLRYSATESFETFPFPQSCKSADKQLLFIGEDYTTHRKHLMQKIQLGLTKTYNQFHNAQLQTIPESDKDTDKKAFEKLYGKESLYLRKHLTETAHTCTFNEACKDIFELRRLHTEMDQAVLEAYGWIDIHLRHDFYELEYLPENDRIRYSIHPDARKEILKRLLLLNHRIHAEENPKFSKVKPYPAEA